MTNAPERIWGLFDQYGHGSTMLRELSQSQSPLFHGPKPTEYIRVDLVEAIVKAALERAAEMANFFNSAKHTAFDIKTGTFPKQSYLGDAIANDIRRLASDPAEVAAIIKKAGEQQ